MYCSIRTPKCPSPAFSKTGISGKSPFEPGTTGSGPMCCACAAPNGSSRLKASKIKFFIVLRMGSFFTFWSSRQTEPFSSAGQPLFNFWFTGAKIRNLFVIVPIPPTFFYILRQKRANLHPFRGIVIPFNNFAFFLAFSPLTSYFCKKIRQTANFNPVNYSL